MKKTKKKDIFNKDFIKKDLIKEEYRNQISLTVLFALIVAAVLLISIAIFVTATFIFSHVGLLEPDNVKSPDITTLIIGVALISIIIGFGVALLTMKYPLKPFTQLITQMNRLAAGDFKARLKFSKAISSHPTFKETSDSFNKMAQELEGSQLLRSDFINNLSHEFKTPIVSIAGFAKLLRKGNLTEEQREEYLAIIEEESLRLSHVATNVLALTKVENQSILTDVSSFNLSEQIRSCVLLLEDKWSKKELELSLDVGEFSISANEELLKQVWINLIENAVKFSPYSGSLRLTAEEENNFYICKISNSGSIDTENIDKIFNKFYQADESRSGEGTGVGLAIVKKITELHSGQVQAEAADGTVTITVKLPKKQYKW